MPDFEAALTELEEIVASMEHGQLNLEDALRQFERGVFLTRHCQQALREAEQKVRILLKDDGGAAPTDFEPNGTDDKPE
jgi:exodeoxyribonuclease VII small subunit